MATKTKYKAGAFEAIHASASALHKAGAINKTTMRGFDESCLATPAEIKPKQIKKMRRDGCRLRAWNTRAGHIDGAVKNANNTPFILLCNAGSRRIPH